MAGKSKVVAVVQARMSSTRLPGKVLLPLAGKPLLWHIVHHLGYCKEVDEIVVATSSHQTDNAVEQWCKDNGIAVYRGSLDDVLSRFLGVIDEYAASYIARITGDTPFVTPEFVDGQVKALQKYDGHVTVQQNCGVLFEGQDVWSARALQEVARLSQNPQDREHVGSFYLVEHPSRFRRVAIRVPEQFVVQGRLFTVDTKEDYALVSRIYEDLYEDESTFITLPQLVAWMGSHRKELSGQEMSPSWQKIKRMQQEAFGSMNIVGEYHVAL